MKRRLPHPMKTFGALLFSFLMTEATAQNTIFDETAIHSVYITLDVDAFDSLLTETWSDVYRHATFVYEYGSTRDTIEDIGLRLRGNTSRNAMKKSFKVDFSEFFPGRRYQGLKQLNLNGGHNDPSLIREKLFYYIWKRAGMPERKATFVRLYINGSYRGLYLNIEELDKIWLNHTYPDPDGNLYKCVWPATLGYLGNDPNLYKNYIVSGRQVYDLKTNDPPGDYSDLANLCSVYNTAPAAGSAHYNIVNAGSIAKAVAIDLVTGNWDNYTYNKNNYFLYRNPADNKFELITYDTDNTIGIDWTGQQDWGTVNAVDFPFLAPGRPLTNHILGNSTYSTVYHNAIDSIVNFITHPDSIYPYIDSLHAFITDAAEDDYYRTMDYGYSIADFHNSYDMGIDGHTPYGVKPFFAVRRQYALSQLAGVTTHGKQEKKKFCVRTSPGSDQVVIEFLVNEALTFQVYNALGQVVNEELLSSGGVLSTSGLSAGIYFVTCGGQTERFVVAE